MIAKEIIQANLANCLKKTDFLTIPNPKMGKVRDSFDCGDNIVLITTDRQSAFDRILTAVPFKGQVLNQVSAFWFENTRDIVKNHVLEIPDPNVTVAKKCTVFPIEFVAMMSPARSPVEISILPILPPASMRAVDVIPLATARFPMSFPALTVPLIPPVVVVIPAAMLPIVASTLPVGVML